MAFNDIQLKVAVQSAVDAVHAEIAPLTLFSHSYNSEIDGQYGSAIAVPTTSLSAGEFGANGYMGEDEFGGELVMLDKQLTTSLRITDKNLAYTGIDFAQNAGKAIGGAIGRACYETAISVASATTLSAAFDPSTGDVFSLPEIAMDNDMPVKGSVALVSPATWTKVMKNIGAYSVYGGTSMIQEGMANNCLGFKAVIPCAYLPDGVNGLIIAENALGTVSRYLPPVFEDGLMATKVVDDENGFVFGLRQFVDNKFGYGYVAGVTLFGAKVLDSKGVLKLA